MVTDQQRDSQDADVQVYSTFQATSHILQTHTRLWISLTKAFVTALLLPKEYVWNHINQIIFCPNKSLKYVYSTKPLLWLLQEPQRCAEV